MKVYRLAVPVVGEEIYEVEAYSRDDAVAQVLDGAHTPVVEVDWEEDPRDAHIMDEWEVDE